MPISARLVASLLERAGANRILALDLHAAQIQGFFDVPVDHLFAAPVMIDYFDEMRGEGLTVVSPDAGGVERARAFAKRLDAPLAIIDKRRTEVNVAEVMHIIGDVAGQECVAFALEDAIPEWYLNNNVRQRSGERAREAGSGIYACRDGYVSMIAGRLGTASAFVALTEWIAESDTPGGQELL